MPNSIFGGLFGGQVGQAYSQTPSALQNAYNHHNQQMSQLGQMNNSQYAQQALYNQYAAQQRQNAFEPARWVIDGRTLSIEDFANELFGDTPERTMFLLRYAGKEKE